MEGEAAGMRVVALFSGGIDSPVAAWLMMKRGAEIELLFLDQRPFVGDRYLDRAVTVAKTLSSFVPLKKYYLTVAPMGTIMQHIAEGVVLCLEMKSQATEETLVSWVQQRALDARMILYAFSFEQLLKISIACSRFPFGALKAVFTVALEQVDCLYLAPGQLRQCLSEILLTVRRHALDPSFMLQKEDRRLDWLGKLGRLDKITLRVGKLVLHLGGIVVVRDRQQLFIPHAAGRGVDERDRLERAFEGL